LSLNAYDPAFGLTRDTSVLHLSRTKKDGEKALFRNMEIDLCIACAFKKSIAESSNIKTLGIEWKMLLTE
jgi:hypothetical protein